jgi:hypothetical protein
MDCLFGDPAPLLQAVHTRASGFSVIVINGTGPLSDKIGRMTLSRTDRRDNVALALNSNA